jgi:hypothetical protein
MSATPPVHQRPPVPSYIYLIERFFNNEGPPGP